MGKRVSSIQKELREKSKECVLAAVKIFNDPLIRFKTESFIVLMIIAWTYLLHSYYRSKAIDYRYFKNNIKRKRYDKTKRGSFKYWELERCLNDNGCPIDKDTKNNLLFLIGLRNEIEHQMTYSLDNYISGRLQACVLNFNHYLCELFKDQSLAQYLSYSLQFLEISEEQIQSARPESEIPSNIKSYITEFDNKLTEDEYNNPHYSYRLFFSKKLANRPGQADKIIEFISSDSELGKNTNKEYWVKKEVEKKKFLPKHIVKICGDLGYNNFRIKDHTDFWKKENAKILGKGYGTIVENTWYWYQNWVDKCLEYCKSQGNKFKKQ